MSKLNSPCSAFFQHQKQSVNTENAVWYEDRPLGVKKLGQMIKTISVGARLSQIYTSHSVRASAITMLSNANVPDRHIMFISGHGSEQSIAHYSSRPSVSQLESVFNTISNALENHRAHKFPPSLVLRSYKARTEWPPTFRCRPQPQAFRMAFLTPVIFRATSRCFSAYRAALMTKSELIFCGILYQIC